MKKRWLSLLILICFSLGLVSGCKEETDGPVNKLNVDGSDVVLKVGDTVYTAEELYGDMLNSGIGADTAYEKILRMVVESTIPVDANMTASWELMLDAFEEEVETTAASNGISEKEAKKQLLAEDGYDSVEEMKDEYLYGVRLSKLQDNYWKETKMDYYNDYFEERLPYFVKHALVKTSYTADRGPFATTIDSSDAKALYNIYDWLVKGYDFSQIMNEYSEDGGSSGAGSGYHMDLTTSFVTEFLHGVFVFDALLKGKEEAVGISESADFYASLAESGKGYNFGVINASDIKVLGDEASDTDTKSITMYENVLNEETSQMEEKSTKNTISTAYGSYSLYARSIIFNQTFNNPGISVIAYDLNDNAAKNVTTLNINGNDKQVLTDENGNIVFVVCARGGSDLQIHFLTVQVSPFDANAKLFFSIDEDATIAEMVAAKKQSLVEANKTEAEINEAVSAYETELKKYRTYVDEKVKNDDTIVNRNKIIEELEGFVESYAKRGITSGIVAGKDQFLTYEMVKYYMGNTITIVNDQIKTLVETYIANQIALIELETMNYIVTGWDEYLDLITLANSEEIVSKKIPMECSYPINGNSDRGALCKYNYETGFEIVMSYTVRGGTMPTEYVKSYHIGDPSFRLPEPTKENDEFLGWYYTSDFKEGTKVELDSIDTSRTSTNNRTTLFAKWASDNK